MIFNEFENNKMPGAAFYLFMYRNDVFYFILAIQSERDKKKSQDEREKLRKKHKTKNSIENYSSLNWYRIWVTRWAFIFKMTHEARHLISMRFKWHLKWICVFANAIIHTKTKKKLSKQTVCYKPQTIIKSVRNLFILFVASMGAMLIAFFFSECSFWMF